MPRSFVVACKNIAAIGAVTFCLTQAPDVRADSASCLAKVSAYVVELDGLLSRERNWLTPYDSLNERYFPFRDCEADALLEVVRSSSFVKSISYLPRTNTYFIHFSSEEVLVSFTYYASEKKSDPATNTALWVHK
jgi:hypothetical protein